MKSTALTLSPTNAYPQISDRSRVPPCGPLKKLKREPRNASCLRRLSIFSCYIVMSGVVCVGYSSVMTSVAICRMSASLLASVPDFLYLSLPS
mmetsp:Transcript_13850/g.25101  ORF Transcript_13850/g.25101 Transcript_13850/m.25101 type:complete len:93 (-) Transcript_13850:191-469(-)